MLTRLQPSSNGQFIGDRDRAGVQLASLARVAQDLHGEAHALHAGLVIFGLNPAEQGFEPAGTPAKPLHRRLQVGGRTHGNLDDDDGGKPAIDLDRMGHASAVGLPGAMGRIVHDALPLLQRRPGRGSEMGYVSAAVRPGRRHGISPSGFVNQQHAGHRPGNKTALDREPGSEKAARRRGHGKISPKRSVLRGLYLPRVVWHRPGPLACCAPPGHAACSSGLSVFIAGRREAVFRASSPDRQPRSSSRLPA